jgi:alkylation response protein AidB-like acyl-CoA dehydrogenase
MRFSFTTEQLALRDAVRSLLASACPPAVVRAAWSVAPGDLDRSPWSSLADMGVLDVLVPPDAGGLGLDWCSLVLLLEETGRVALPHPVVETAAIAAPLVSPRGAMLSASLGGSAAVCGSDADLILVDHREALWLAERAAIAGSELVAVDGARRLLLVEAIDEASATLVASGSAALASAFDRAALGAAAQLLGLSQAMLDMAVRHVSERHQFGVPVGSFQAVKHKLADALMELSFARPAVYRAAWSLSTGDPEAAAHVSMAKAMASDAAETVGRAALQTHGAIGYAVEYDLHLFLKRAWALSRAWGSAAWHRDRFGTAIGI